MQSLPEFYFKFSNFRNFTDFREEAFNDPDFNAFEQGPAVKECNEKKTIVLKNVPEQLKQHTIEGMLSKFGKITRVFIPPSQEFRGSLMHVFIDFSTFL